MTSRIFHPLLSLLASLTRQELARQVAYLKAENRILRARLPDRLVSTDKERQKLIRAGRKLGVQLKELMTIVTYGSFVRWIREMEDEPKKEMSPEKERKSGRPRTADEIRELVIRIRNALRKTRESSQARRNCMSKFIRNDPLLVQ